MKYLETLALREIRKLAQELSDGLIGISIKATTEKKTINPEKDIYPLRDKAGNIRHWVEAIEKQYE